MIDNLYMFVYINDQKYSPEQYGETTVTSSMKEEIFGFGSAKGGVIDPFQIQMNQVQSEEDLLGLGFSFN